MSEEELIPEVSFKLLVGEMTMDEVKVEIRELLEVIDGNCENVSKMAKSIERLRDIIRALDVDVVIDLFLDMSHNPIGAKVLNPFKDGLKDIIKSGSKNPWGRTVKFGDVIGTTEKLRPYIGTGTADDTITWGDTTDAAVPKGYKSSTTAKFHSCVAECVKKAPVNKAIRFRSELS